MEEQNKKDKRKILVIGSICLLLIIIMAGYTYSYFVVRDTDTSTITGTVASGELEIEVNQVAPSSDQYKNKGLVPQKDTAIASAVKGTTANCVDDNGSAVCKVYEVTVTNKSNMVAKLDGKVKLNALDNPNLKWALIDSYTAGMTTKPTLETDANPYSEVIMVENVEFGAVGANNATQTYYLVVWISETGGAQYDTGVFTGEITFEPTIYTSYVLKKPGEVTSSEADFLGTGIKRGQIYSIEFINTSDAPDGITGIDVSLIGDESVLLYYTESGNTNFLGNTLYDVKIGTETGTTIASSGAYLFSYLEYASNISLTSLDTSEVTNMSNMFNMAWSLTTLDLSSLDTSKVTNMSNMFGALVSTINFGNFDTSSVINMSGMFRAGGFQTLDLSSFNTSKVTDMSSMFHTCHLLTSISVSSNFVTTNVASSNDMFANCASLVGGNGTLYNSSITDKTYARIDTADKSGYFTLKSA